MSRREDILSGRFVLMLERKVAEGIEDPGSIVVPGNDPGCLEFHPLVPPSLDKYFALKMRFRNIGGTDYIFTESDEFSTRHKPGWKSGWHVMKRP